MIHAQMPQQSAARCGQDERLHQPHQRRCRPEWTRRRHLLHADAGGAEWAQLDFEHGATGTAYTITTLQPDESTREAKRVNLACDAPGFTLTPATLTFNSRGLLTSGAVMLKAQGRGQADSVLVLVTGQPYRFD